MDKQDLLNKHLDYVLEANKIHNLTTITDKKEAEILHIEDSLCALKEVETAEDGSIADLGSGAGYPGIPLAIMSGRKTTLIESVGKKAECLKAFISKLDIMPMVSVNNCRIEEVAMSDPESFTVVTARALSSISSLLELASPLLRIGGTLICYKSYNINDELIKAINIQRKIGMQFTSNREYSLSNGTKRRIISFHKESSSKIKLPRKFGFAQKKPFKS